MAAAPASRLDGKATSALLRADLKERVADFVHRSGGVVPSLSVVLVGDRPDSAVYVRQKVQAGAEVGIKVTVHHVADAEATHPALERLVRELNERADVHGVIVQSPLPSHLSHAHVASLVAPVKDVDGLLPESLGRLAERDSSTSTSPGAPVSCTPRGCLYLIESVLGRDLSGKRAVVLGRSNIVGVPMALLLTRANATVTLCHSRSPDIADECRRADILVAAIGKPRFVQGDWVKQGAVVIDVGINQIDDATTKSGHRLVGDVDFAAAAQRASYITPVPGGVGPMTVFMLLQQTYEAACRQTGTPPSPIGDVARS